MARTDEYVTSLDGVTATGAGEAIEHDGLDAVDDVYEVIVTDSATVTFQGTVNGDNWYTVQATDLSDGSGSTTAGSGTGLFRVNGTGLAATRPNVTSYTSGSVTARAFSQRR